MALKAWPFLIGRGRGRGQLSIVAPDFIVNGGLAGLLPTQLAGNVSPSWRTYKDSTELGQITAHYLVENVRFGDEVLRDAHGRPIVLFVGLVTRGSVSIPEGRRAQLIETARPRLIRSFEEFLENEDNFTVVASEPLSSSEPEGSNPLFPETTGRPSWFLLLAIGLLVGFFLGGVTARFIGDTKQDPMTIDSATPWVLVGHTYQNQAAACEQASRLGPTSFVIGRDDGHFLVGFGSFATRAEALSAIPHIWSLRPVNRDEEPGRSEVWPWETVVRCDDLSQSEKATRTSRRR